MAKIALQRKEQAIDAVIKANLHIKPRDLARLLALQEIEDKFSVQIHLEENYCISAWTDRTPIIKRFV